MARRPTRSLLLALLISAAGLHEVAAQTYTVAISASTPDLGNVVSAPTGSTTFRAAASSGAISRVTGTGVRLSTTTSRAMVTVTCSNVNACTTSNVSVRVGTVGTPAGRAGALTNFTATSGTATITGTPTGTSQLNLTLTPLPKTGGRTFYVGADMPILGDDSGRATGAASSGFYVYAVRAGSTPTVGSTAGLAIARVYRPISTTLNSNLGFGRLVRPATGSGSVAVDAATGARTLSAGAALGTPGPTRAAYTVTGEGGQAFSIAVPTSFVMNSTGGSLTVATSTTATGSQVLSSALGSAGTYGFGVGGSFPLASTTPPGSYSGTFSVTVQYN